MRKHEIASEFGFINGMSIFSNTAVIESKLYAAMDKYAQEEVKNLTLHRVSVSFADFLLTHKQSDEVQKATAHQLFKEFIEAYER